jgi:serine/threonine-protein kinase RsbW
MSSTRPSILNLRLQSRPESAGVVRTMLTGIAGPLRLPSKVLDDLKTAISEACNNAVEHAYRGDSGVIAVHVEVQPDAVSATVRDWGGGFQQIAPAAGDRMRVGLPLINALADRAEFLSAPGSGTEVRLEFDLQHDAQRAELLDRLDRSEDLEAWAPWRRGLSGELVVTLLPAELLASVLGPLTSAFAARSRFSLERFSDVYLATSVIVEHVMATTSSSRISFALSGAEHQLDLAIGPLRADAGRRLQAATAATDAAAPLASLMDELGSEPIGESELLRVVLVNHDDCLSGAKSS